MLARLAPGLTTCQTALGVILSHQIFLNRRTRRKIVPLLMPAAVVHSSTARFTHTGTGTVRMCFLLPLKDFNPPEQRAAQRALPCSRRLAQDLALHFAERWRVPALAIRELVGSANAKASGNTHTEILA